MGSRQWRLPTCQPSVRLHSSSSSSHLRDHRFTFIIEFSWVFSLRFLRILHGLACVGRCVFSQWEEAVFCCTERCTRLAACVRKERFRESEQIQRQRQGALPLQRWTEAATDSSSCLERATGDTRKRCWAEGFLPKRWWSDDLWARHGHATHASDVLKALPLT